MPPRPYCERADDIVQHAYGNVVLHHWHMLVSRGVENGVNALGLHQIEWLVWVTEGTKNWQ
jgi:hypothetical protein